MMTKRKINFKIKNKYNMTRNRYCTNLHLKSNKESLINKNTTYNNYI